MTSHEICKFFYKISGEGLFKCNKSGVSRKQQPGSGFSNLIGHLTNKHPQFREEYEELQRTTTTLANYGFVDERKSEIYQWLAWVIERSHPVSEVEQPLTCQLARIAPVSSKTLKMFIQHIAAKVGTTLSAELGSAFDLMFDGWTCGLTRFVALYALYTVDGDFCEPLLAIYPMENGQPADAHIEFVRNVLELCEKILNTVLLLE